MKCALFASVLLLYLLVGCRAPVAPPRDEVLEALATTGETAEDDDGAMVMRGIDLYMHRKSSPEGVAGKPELWVRADSFSILGVRAYQFENARAVIYGGDQREDIVIEAQRGNFEQDRRALLEGDVKMTAGALYMHLRDIEWLRPDDDAAAMARTDSTVIIDDPDLQLNAAALRLYPEERKFELNDVSGVVRFEMELL